MEIVNIEDVKLDNWRGLFFQAQAQSGFASRYSQQAMRLHNWGYVFVSSDKCDSDSRLYTVRYQKPNGHVVKLSEFQQYNSSGVAWKAAQRFTAELEKEIDTFALALLDWHGGGGSGLYATGSTILSGSMKVLREQVARAISELEDVFKCDGYTVEEIAQVTALRDKLVADYQK